MFNLTNYFEHPSRPGHFVFRFYEKERSDYFEKTLQDKSVWYEHSVDNIEEDRIVYLFGVKNDGYKEAVNANYLVSAKFRKKTVPNQYVRLVIYIVSLGLITLAIIGAMRN
jgi:hypothetical protein